MTAVISALDTDRFGVVTAKAQIESLDDLVHLEEFSATNQVRFAIIRVSAKRLRIIQQATQKGFELMDTLVYFSYAYQNAGNRGLETNNKTLRLAVNHEGPAIKDVARAAFAGYLSHYHADIRLNQEDCDAVYSDWAFRSATTKEVADGVLVYEDADGIAGFGTLRYAPNGKIADGPLFGVHPRAQGKGVFRALLRAAKDWGRKQGAVEFRYSTQITNLKAQKVLCTEGFVPVCYEYTLHKWYKNDSF